MSKVEFKLINDEHCSIVTSVGLLPVRPISGELVMVTVGGSAQKCHTHVHEQTGSG